jgi:hypothetical protein
MVRFRWHFVSFEMTFRMDLHASRFNFIVDPLITALRGNP